MDNLASILLPLAFGMFLIGFYGFLTRKNAFTAFICIEVMLNSANLSLVIFSSAYFKLGGMLFVVVLIVLAALDAVIGLSLIWLLKQLTGKTELKILAID